MSAMSRNKGKRGEREVRRLLEARGIEHEWTAQTGSGPDILVKLPERQLWMEVKFRESEFKDEWWDSIRAHGGMAAHLGGVVVYRRKRRPWWIAEWNADCVCVVHYPFERWLERHGPR